MKEPFKIGDRVRVYYGVYCEAGEIKVIQKDLIQIDERDGWFHVKQCRRLRPKKKRVKKTLELWANLYPGGGYSIRETKSEADDYRMPNRIACVKLTGSYYVEE